ncbi:MAG: hypothetical protein NTU88_02520, partial [Armatimonadetes bacterium]|nr:hypothetical protein [Armatimonadota bacterium]
MPGYRKTLKKWISTSYEFLGLVIISSFIWFGIIIGGVGLITRIEAHESPVLLFVSLAAFYVLFIAPLTAGVYLLAKKIVTRDDPSVFDIFHGFREFLAPSWSLGFAHVLITLMIAANAWFYLTRGGIALKAVGVLVLYVLILWGLSAVYHYPVMIEQRPGTFKTLKRGFLLALDNFAFTVGVIFAIILLTCLCAVTLLGMPLIYLGMLSILQTQALRALFVKYELLPPEREPEPGGEETWTVEP